LQIPYAPVQAGLPLGVTQIAAVREMGGITCPGYKWFLLLWMHPQTGLHAKNKLHGNLIS